MFHIMKISFNEEMRFDVHTMLILSSTADLGTRATLSDRLAGCPYFQSYLYLPRLFTRINYITNFIKMKPFKINSFGTNLTTDSKQLISSYEHLDCMFLGLIHEVSFPYILRGHLRKL